MNQKQRLIQYFAYAILAALDASAQEILPECRYNWSTSGATNQPVVNCQSGYTDDNGNASGGSCRLVPTDGTTPIGCANGYTDSNGVVGGGTCVSLATASGGDSTTTMTQNEIQYQVHVFTANGSFVPIGNMEVDVLVVGGGGAGGARHGGGGGGGGVLFTTGYAISGTQTINIGAGGSASSSTTATGAAGGNSSFGNLTALGGGGGGSANATAGTTGGNGGGAAGGDSSGRGVGTVGQGNSGGGGSGTGVESYYAGGGGGGGRMAGGNATLTSPAIAGSGGDGTASQIAGTVQYYGGGGGGGAAATAATAGSGGSGGGGAGSKGAVAATSGTANTGGGGGGGGFSGATNGMPGSGGSGIVIVRYPMSGCSADYTDSNGSASNGTCISSTVTTGTGNACDSGYTDSNGPVSGGTCIPNTITTGIGSACDDGYVDSNGLTTGGSCIVGTVTTGSGNACATNYSDDNGTATGGLCVLNNVPGTAIVCASGYTDNNNTDSGGVCVVNNISNTAATCANDYTDSNGTASGGQCIVSTVTTIGGNACDVGYFDTNGNTSGGTCNAILASCKAILQAHPTSATRAYRIDPDGAGTGSAEFNAYCDMTTNGGGWTVVYGSAGGNSENGLSGNTESTANNPISFLYYNLDRTKKLKISANATESILVRSNNEYLKWSRAMFSPNLTTANTMEKYGPLTCTSTNGTTATCYAGWSNYNNSSGGDFGVTNSSNFDNHSTSYYMLNGGCSGQYFYSYSAVNADGDQGYDVNTALSGWSASSPCNNVESGHISFYAAMR